MIVRATRALAEIVAAERGARTDDVEPWVIANALMGVNRAITRVIHFHALQRRSGPEIARMVLTQARRAFDILEHGLTE